MWFFFLIFDFVKFSVSVFALKVEYQRCGHRSVDFRLNQIKKDLQLDLDFNTNDLKLHLDFSL